MYDVWERLPSEILEGRCHKMVALRCNGKEGVLLDEMQKANISKKMIIQIGKCWGNTRC